MNLITYADKVTLNKNPDVAEINKVTAANMNEIKNVINNLIYPIGTYYETSDLNFDPNIMWGGTWELDEDGTVLVSKSNVSDSKFNADLGTVVGEETHTLTTNEIPSHKHDDIEVGGNHLTAWNNKDGSTAIISLESLSSTNGVANQNYFGTGYAGGGQAHNNVQPSKIVNRWHRTA